MKFIGIDYGEKRVGVAVSDATGRIAFPKAVFPNDCALLSSLVELIRAEGVEGIIMGESRNLEGRDNPVMVSIRKFAEALQKETDIAVTFEPEFFSSVEARRLKDTTGAVDAEAAAVILTSYLNRINTYDDFS